MLSFNNFNSNGKNDIIHQQTQWYIKILDILEIMNYENII
jgi:hypothetical protein